MKVITSKISKRIVNKINKNYNILFYDSDNLYPQHILDICHGSGITESCQELHRDFMFGDGFEKNGDVVINRLYDTELNKLLYHTIDDYSYFNGFAIHVNYNANFKIHSLTRLQFSNTRLGIPDDYDRVGKIAYYNNWDRKYGKQVKKNMISYVDTFNPDPDVIAYQVKSAGGWKNYKGQILWYSKDGDYVYPRSPFDPVLEDIETDSKIKTYKYRSVVNGFSAGHLLIWRGKFESAKAEQDFEDNLNKFQGEENAGSIFLVQLDYDEQKPEIEKFEQFNTDKLFQYTEKSIQDNIRKRKKIPPVLIGDLTVGRLGTAEEIFDATVLFNAFTGAERKFFEKVFTKLMKLYKRPVKQDLKIKKLSIIEDGDIEKRKKLKETEKTTTAIEE